MRARWSFREHHNAFTHVHLLPAQVRRAAEQLCQGCPGELPLSAYALAMRSLAGDLLGMQHAKEVLQKMDEHGYPTGLYPVLLSHIAVSSYALAMRCPLLTYRMLLQVGIKPDVNAWYALVPSYARTTRCPVLTRRITLSAVLTYRICLRVPYTMSGTNLAHGPRRNKVIAACAAAAGGQVSIAYARTGLRIADA
eukprot:2065186-Rhodomonas_salina.1